MAKAAKRSKGEAEAKAGDPETGMVDLLDMKVEDINGKRYGVNLIMLRTKIGMLIMIRKKTAVRTWAAFTKIKARIESETDPGDKDK